MEFYQIADAMLEAREGDDDALIRQMLIILKQFYYYGDTEIYHYPGLEDTIKAASARLGEGGAV